MPATMWNTNKRQAFPFYHQPAASNWEAAFRVPLSAFRQSAFLQISAVQVQLGPARNG